MLSKVHRPAPTSVFPGWYETEFAFGSITVISGFDNELVNFAAVATPASPPPTITILPLASLAFK